ncbi:MAG: hypothetical protein WBL45_03680 [Solirubrobacterales bacterium]
MPILEIGDVRNLIESAVTAISVLGGAMAFESGYAANRATSESLPPQILAQRINKGLAKGFSWSRTPATFCLIFLLWT